MEIPNSGDQYNLKWNNHLANFVQTFIEHQNGESLVDVTLSCEGQYIKAHKLILSACSDYFHSIFQVHGTIQHPIILLNGVKFIDLKYILHFMYHGEVKVLDKDLPNVLALGETLQIKGLSSVKLRDMPPEANSTSTVRSSKKHRSIVSHLEPRIFSSQVPVPLPLPSEIPFIQSTKERKAPIIDSRKVKVTNNRTSQMTKPELQTHSVEDSPLKKILISESPPVSVNAQNTSPSNNTETPKEIKHTHQIPKPPHAFMIFANEWRKKLTVEHPEENNKEISVRLGNMWKNLLPETKNVYYKAAKRAEEEHKTNYPEYPNLVGTPKRKADVLNDSTNTNSPTTSVDPMEIVEIQEQITVSDSDS